MAESGILQPDERVKLLEGQMIQMAAKGTAHRAAVIWIQRLFEQRLGDRVFGLFRMCDCSAGVAAIAGLIADNVEESH